MTSVDLALDEIQQAIADAVEKLCRDQCGDDAVRAAVGGFPADLWKSLVELGVLSLATPEGEGGVQELVAACEPLGRAVFPGPLPAVFYAMQVLPPESRAAVAAGRCIVSVGAPPLLPWAPVAQLFVEVQPGRAWLARPRGAVAPGETLGGEPGGRAALERERELEGARRAEPVYAVALAAYLAAAGRRLVDETAEHARSRRQFGRPLGEFQAVAHPLADCAIQLDGAAALARSAACALDAAADEAGARAAAARLAASRAALQTARCCHQLFGAVGITLEGPVFPISRRIRQLVSQAPTADSGRAALLRRFGLGEPA